MGYFVAIAAIGKALLLQVFQVHQAADVVVLLALAQAHFLAQLEAVELIVFAFLLDEAFELFVELPKAAIQLIHFQQDAFKKDVSSLL